jgi:hypothetical protein
MATIVTRAGKGSPLTNTEVDSNFTNLNTDKLEINAALGTPASVTLTNATGLPTAGLVDNAVTDAKLRDSAGLSVIGRGANSTGDPADIVAGTNKQVLRRDGSSLAFGAVDLSSNQAVTGTLPVNQGGTGITSFGSGVATWLGTPSSANLAAAVTDETGTGALVFGTNPVIDGATIPARTNPLARAIAVQMTAAASGSNGISALSSTAYDLGTSDATLNWRGSIASNLSGSEVHRFVGKYQNSDNRWQVTYTPSTRTLAVQVNKTGSLIFLATTVLPVALPLNIVFDYHAVIIRETASSAGSVTFYINGVSVGSAAITAAATVDISNTGNLNISGNTLFAPLRLPTSTHGAAIYNRALTAAEVLDLSINGPALADRGAGQAAKLSSDFSAGTGGYSAFGTSTVLAGNQDGVFGEDDALLVTTTSGANNAFSRTSGNISLVAGERWRMRFRAAVSSLNVGPIFVRLTNNDSSGTTNYSGLSAPQQISPSDTWAEYEIAFTVAATTNTGGRIYLTTDSSGLSAGNRPADGNLVYFKDIRWVKLGLTSELIASNAQSNTGQIFDTSGNKNHALLPASGATIVGANPARSRQVRSRHQWTATNELQYLTGVNQEVLPPSAAIEFIDIFSDASLDVNIGNGTTATQYASAASLVAGWNRVTLANFYAGTTVATRKLTVTPTSSATAVLDFVVTYHAAETE